ncbi:MAG: ribosome recycling factor [Longimicrobiales bacterium]|jgi:ribosome recycling factor|nr:ribosome recycling factor [Longimicrobiales bacterium]|tara:strand:+ start:834 stop:1385 length:552 start_codon:yes stop_codon:yes gene_type:complete
MMSLDILEIRMEGAIESLIREFSSVRTGKATPALLDSVRVDAYGSLVALNQVANVSTPEPSLLVVQPYDKTLLNDIERAIQTANLGLNPGNDGNLIRIPIPPLTEERRREYVKIIHQMAEEARVSLRHARKAGNDETKNDLKAGEIGEDEGRDFLGKIQKMTDGYTDKIDELLEKKEKELMAI